MRKIIAIGGEPAVGKSTIMKEYIKSVPDFEEIEPVKLLPSLYSPSKDLYLLGRYPDGEPFGGTDRFSMAVQPVAKEFVENTTSSIIFEGDRLFNQSFLEFLAELPEVWFRIFIITASRKAIDDRHVGRADTQSDVFKKGRNTKVETLRSSFALMEYITELENENPHDYLKCAEALKTYTLKTH